ncbi:hypothetical protein VNO77_20615 [Canavalia gladiata]|uniref:Uncharacterized protein n=1 Tax=Canavalia gladiata TaxID=3824 RepID=A0AAN9LTH4_CANGL
MGWMRFHHPLIILQSWEWLRDASKNMTKRWCLQMMSHLQIISNLRIVYMDAYHGILNPYHEIYPALPSSLSFDEPEVSSPGTITQTLFLTSISSSYGRSLKDGVHSYEKWHMVEDRIVNLLAMEGTSTSIIKSSHIVAAATCRAAAIILEAHANATTTYSELGGRTLGT